MRVTPLQRRQLQGVKERMNTAVDALVRGQGGVVVVIIDRDGGQQIIRADGRLGEQLAAAVTNRTANDLPALDEHIPEAPKPPRKRAKKAS